MNDPGTSSSLDGAPVGRGRRLGLTLLAIAGILLILFFGMRAVRSYMRLRQVQPGEGTPSVDLLRGWMTVEYISRLYQVPEEELFAGMNIPPEGNATRSLGDLTRHYYPGQPGLLISLVKTTIEIHRIEQGLPALPTNVIPPTPIIPDTPVIPQP